MGKAGLTAVRLTLYLAGSAAPLIGYVIATDRAGGNAESGVVGLLWGLPGAVIAAILFSLTFRASGTARLGYAAVAFFAAPIAWGLFGLIQSWFHA